MEKIELNDIAVQTHCCSYIFTVSQALNRYFSEKAFRIEYQEIVSDVPKAILAVPFVCNVLPIVWLEDAELLVPELDRDFYNCIEEIKKGFINMYPEAEFKGKITVSKIVDCSPKNPHGSLAFFSGGVDATTTLIRHIDEKPMLFTLWGADVAYDNESGWNTVYPAIERTAQNYGLSAQYAHTSFREFDEEWVLHQKYEPLLGKGWWYGIKHGIGIISHAAPLVWLHGIKNVYFASSNCPEDGTKVKCASDPRIDNQIRFCGAQVYHDGFELNRQKKVKAIVDFHKSHLDIPIELHVCWESSSGKNCCHCEKCYRTMAELWIEGEDPHEYGFEYPDSIFDDLYSQIALHCNNMAKNTWTYAKERMQERWSDLEKEEYAKKLRWIMKFDFKNLEKNPCRIRAARLKIVKKAVRYAVHPKMLIKRLFPKAAQKYSLIKNKPLIMNWSDEEREAGVKRLYWEKMGKQLDLNNVQTFSEKLQWYKLYYNHPDLPRCVCKYCFKQYIEEKVGKGHTVPLIGAWTDVDEIPWEELPERFVFKSNAQSDGNFIIFVKDKSQENWLEMKQKMRVWLKPENTLVNSYCRAYYDVTPMIIAEEYIEQLDHQLYDYKFFCFDGEPKFAYVASEHFKDGKKLPVSNISLYDLSWNKLPIRYGKHKPNNVPAPECLDEMIRASRLLAKEFPFVRIDFFEVDGEWYLSELTFYPGGGYNDLDQETNSEWGVMFKLPAAKKLGRKFRFDLL